MKLETRDPYYFTGEGIKKIESMKDATYMGYWCGKSPSGGWNERPIDVFYVQEPDTDKGHTNYFGMLVQGDRLLITDASSCFSEPMTGIVEQDIVYVSRYRHDFVQTPAGQIIDGGRDYYKGSVGSKTVTVSVKDGEFLFAQRAEADVEKTE